MTTQTDRLAEFVMNATDRDLDYWWESHMYHNGDPVPRGTGALSWSTDRRLRHVIEDRVEKAGVEHAYICHLGVMRRDPTGEAILWHCLRAQPRQYILAAARALGIEAPDREGVRRD